MTTGLSGGPTAGPVQLTTATFIGMPKFPKAAKEALAKAVGALDSSLLSQNSGNTPSTPTP